MLRPKRNLSILLKEDNMNIMEVYPLRVKGFININGGLIFKDKPSINDIRGWVPARFSPGMNEERLLSLDRGGYVVEFEDDLTAKIRGNYWELAQANLFESSMALTLNLEPFKGYLVVNAPSQIEAGATIAYVRVFKKEATKAKTKKEKDEEHGSL